MLAILKKDAPTILRIPISFVLLLAKNEAKPNRPRQAMLIGYCRKYRINFHHDIFSFK
jgi:hypothetical protein